MIKTMIKWRKEGQAEKGVTKAILVTRVALYTGCAALVVLMFT